MVPRDRFEAYVRALAANADLVEAAVERLIDTLDRLTDEQVRELFADAYADLVEEYGGYAAQAASELYTELRMGSGAKGAFEAEAARGDRALLVSDVRRYLSTGRIDAASARVSLPATAGRRAMERADDTMVSNALRDPARPKWAFVPNPGACGWCVLMGSRGFEYSSEASARAARHGNCRCATVVDFDTENPALEGYDDEAMRRAYADARATVEEDAEREWLARGNATAGGEGYQRFLRNRIVGEMNLRDRDWLQTGIAPKAVYSKPRGQLLPHERAGVDRLLAHGMALETIPEDPTAPANLDLLMSGREWEMKNVSNSSGSVGNQLARARKKFYLLNGPTRHLIITTEGCRDPFENVLAAIMSRIRESEEIILLGEKGEMVRMKK